METVVEVPNPGYSSANTNPSNSSRGNQNSRGRRNNQDRSRSTNAPPRNRSEDQDSRTGQLKPSRQPAARPSGSGSSPASAVSPEGQTPPVLYKRNFKQRHESRPSNNTGNDADTTLNNGIAAGSTSRAKSPGGGKFRRRTRFNAGLTKSESDSGAASTTTNHSTRHTSKNTDPVAEDLTSILIHALRTPPYPDCPICFSAIHPAQPTWSCSPSIPVIRTDDKSVDDQQYCWTTFHVKCIGSWASKSVKDVVEAWRARGDESHVGEWRCPGCQAKREKIPSGYWCFCNSTPAPKPPRLATPHSCANPCSRPRESGCGHPCPLACHPGPCPPCQITTTFECYCPRKKVLAFRCALDNGRDTKAKGRDLSCGDVCGRTLGCGKHQCQQVCHDGPCGHCEIKMITKCWCNRQEKEMRCGEGKEVVCATQNDGSWIGRFACGNICDRLFDCGIHKCQQSCHPPSFLPATCPRSPSKITHCPCGARPIGSTSLSVSDTSPTPFPARSACTSPIPTCLSTCGKAHPDCDHPCAAKCHLGPCPPCSVSIVRPCRCGATTKTVLCFELRLDHTSGGEILCDKPCMALRACGRHQCRRPCCPLASFSSGAKKGKKRLGGGTDLAPGVGEEQGGLHECDLICGKLLGCGNHTCEERDHKGGCPPCLRSSFEELVCHCGRTVLEPPIPCGTQIRCKHQCSRPDPPCGHPSTQHACHEELPCPPCPFLDNKLCACGKKVVNNVKCSLETEKVSCGAVCGKLMSCGFHSCQRFCHNNECGPCTAPCGKSRKLCLPDLHPCTLTCHAPSACSEDAPCQSLVTLTCACGRLRQSVHCSRSTSSPSAQRTPPKCNNDCMIAKRNARLADALQINPLDREKAAAASYHSELVAFAQSDTKFLGTVEKAFAEFVTSDKKTQVLPVMPPERRKFVHDLANVYRMDTQMVDQAPKRSVRLLRRLDTRIPTPLLSNIIAPPKPTPPNFGKLTDLRSGTTPSWRVQAPLPSNAVPQRGGTPITPHPVSNTPTSRPGTPGSLARTPIHAGGSRVSTPPIHRQPPTQSPAINSDGPSVPESWEDDV